MLLKKKFSLVAIVLLVLGLSFGCTSDEEVPEEPVQPEAAEEPVIPPVEDVSAQEFAPETVFFAFDDYTLNMEAQTKLNAMAEHLKNNPNSIVQVEGHCDERGSIEYNLALGERRAQSVKNYLVQLGIDPARLTTISYGEEKPAVDGHDESAWSQNRRAEFVLSSQ